MNTISSTFISSFCKILGIGPITLADLSALFWKSEAIPTPKLREATAYIHEAAVFVCIYF
jgi:hypothetical protein